MVSLTQKGHKATAVGSRGRRGRQAGRLGSDRHVPGATCPNPSTFYKFLFLNFLLREDPGQTVPRESWVLPSKQQLPVSAQPLRAWPRSKHTVCPWVVPTALLRPLPCRAGQTRRRLTRPAPEQNAHDTALGQNKIAPKCDKGSA